MVSVTGGTMSETEGAIITDCVEEVWMIRKELGYNSLYMLHNGRWRGGTLIPVVDIA